MNVAQLIEELSKLPQHLPVRGYMTCVTVMEDTPTPHDIHPASVEAQEVTNLQWRGYDVVLECGGIAA